MRSDSNRPILYIDEDTTPESQEAKQLLKSAGFDVDVKIAPSQYRAAYGTPVLLGSSIGSKDLKEFKSFLRMQPGHRT